MRTVLELRHRGGTCIVINPMRERGYERFAIPSDVRSLFTGSKMCDLYVQPHIGGDRALLAGIAKELIERGQVDQAFCAAHVDHLDEYIDSIQSLSWDDIQQRSGVDRTIIADLADRYARSKATVFAWAMGITHHVDGVENVQAIAALACLRGMVGRSGAGLLPLRGHSTSRAWAVWASHHASKKHSLNA